MPTGRWGLAFVTSPMGPTLGCGAGFEAKRAAHYNEFRVLQAGPSLSGTEPPSPDQKLEIESG